LLPAAGRQTVRKGDILAELDKTELQLQYERSRSTLNQVLARLGLDPAQANEQPATTPAVRQATAQLEDARFKFESAQKLVAGGDISRQRFSEAEKTLRERQAALDGALDEMRTLWANAETLKTEVRLSEKRLKDAVIRAPFDGAVSERRAAPGQYVKDNVPLLTLVKAYPLRLRLEAPEPATAAMKPGTPLEFTTEAVEEKTFSAVVRELTPALNEQSQIRNALQAVETSRQRIAAAEASARAAREKLESETRLFQTGESTNFLVLTRQNEFSDSRRRIVLATLEFNKSVARLAFSLGRTLEAYKVRLP
jgi:multidrug resistance efflux pump